MPYLDAQKFTSDQHFYITFQLLIKLLLSISLFNFSMSVYGFQFGKDEKRFIDSALKKYEIEQRSRDVDRVCHTLERMQVRKMQAPPHLILECEIRCSKIVLIIIVFILLCAIGALA